MIDNQHPTVGSTRKGEGEKNRRRQESKEQKGEEK
jgi:hypothetical protein